VRVATDIGGTFTDLVYLDDRSGDVGLTKVSTTPPEFERAVLSALAKAGISPENPAESFVHGTTVIINAVTERTGSKTALITTAGFRDVLEIGRSNRPALYNLRFEKPRPFVERYLRFEVAERIDHHGEVLVELDEEQVATAAQRAVEADCEAIAIAFLHAYANPAHEQRALEVVRQLYPDLFVTISSAISGEWREYERTNTAVFNAYVQAPASRYLGHLEEGLTAAGVGEHRYIMQSNGGTASFERAKEMPIALVESGPVAGVMGAAVIGQLIGRDNVLALDIGGTTAKTSLIREGAVNVSTEYKLEWTPETPGYPIKVPVVDIVEIGTGGGSIASIDVGGALTVGPRSAGAVPGPACYPNGSEEPTVTDANLISGRIDPENYLGGDLEVSLERSCRVMERLARRLSVDVDEAAAGIIRLANAKMVAALKLVSVRRGFDTREFDMVAFGGGGSMHAAALAAELRLGSVIVPPAPAHFSAWGMLMTDLRADYIKTLVSRSDEMDESRFEEIWADLERAAIDQLAKDGVDPGRISLARAIDMRYEGQEHTVHVPIGQAPANADDMSAIDSRFHDAHERLYTFTLDAPVEVVNFHVTVFGAVEKPHLQRIRENRDVEIAHKGRRTVNFDEYGVLESDVFARGSLGAGATASGPAIIEDPAATTVVLPGQRFTVDEFGNIIIALGAQNGAGGARER
jgi:N-methylhydantoinase A